MPRNPDVHPTVVRGERVEIGAETTVGAGAHLGEGMSIGGGGEVGEHVVISAGVRLGDRCRLGAGVFVQSGVELGNDVVVGPNASFVSSTFGRSGKPDRATSVRDGASIGANAVVLDGVVLGTQCMVGAGSVVSTDVPPYAVVVGSPAQIVGYQASSAVSPSTRLRASSLSDSDFPQSLGKASLDRHPSVEDLRGRLSFGEFPSQLPFVPHRYFLVFGVPTREVRGEHAHRALHQLLICVHGECSVAVDDGMVRGEVVLDRPDVALHLPPMVWGSQYRYSSDAVLLVLASAPYDAGDYVRDYDEFVDALHRG